MTCGAALPVWRFLAIMVFASAVLGIWTACAQTNTGDNSAASNPTRLLVCEAADDSCLQANRHYESEWSFDGTTGVVTSPASESNVQLAIESMAADKIVIRREDPSGRSATYSGTIHGNSVSGTVQWSSSTHPDTPTSGKWSGVFQGVPAAVASSTDTVGTSSQGLPLRLIECEGNGPCNGAWTFDGLNGTATWFTQSPVHAKLTIVRSDPDEITIRRTDLTDGNSAVYHGVRKGDTYSGAVIDQGVYAAQRTVSDMYMLGQGTPKDRDLSKFYGDKAEEQKRDRQHQIEREEDRADRAADRAANAMTGFVMGAVFRRVALLDRSVAPRTESVQISANPWLKNFLSEGRKRQFHS